MGHQLAGVLDEIRQQPELGRRQPDLVAAQPRPMVVEIDHEVAMLEPARPLGRGRGRSAQGGLDPGQQLREAQRLGDVVVGAQLQAADLVGLGAAGRDHEDRHPAELADPLDDLPAVEPGQRDVEDDEVGMLVVEPAQGVVAGRARRPAGSRPGPSRARGGRRTRARPRRSGPSQSLPGSLVDRAVAREAGVGPGRHRPGWLPQPFGGDCERVAG